MATPDSGSTRSVIIRGTADLLVATKIVSKSSIRLITIPFHQIDLANGISIKRNEHALTNIILITPGAKIILHDVIMNGSPLGPTFSASNREGGT